MTPAEIAKKYDVHPNMISVWKKQVAQDAAQLFARGAGQAPQASDEQIKQLHAKIGQPNHLSKNLRAQAGVR